MSLSTQKTILPVSVVIATLGGGELESTLLHLRNAASVPDEILICIPQNVTPQASITEDACVRILWTPCRGQVAQRAYGLARTRNTHVLQMDDDVILSTHALADLYQASLKLGIGNAVSPVYKHAVTNDYLTCYKNDLSGLLKSLSAYLIGGARWGYKRMGKIDRAGIPYAIDPGLINNARDSLVETDWLPGGCVICHQSDLVLDNYYPFAGKAYSEDVIHSVLWRQHGVRLWVAADIAVHTHLVAMPSTLKSILADYRARVHVIQLNGGSVWRCRIWFFVYALRKMLAKLVVR
jgi:hypothetical protein